MIRIASSFNFTEVFLLISFKPSSLIDSSPTVRYSRPASLRFSKSSGMLRENYERNTELYRCGLETCIAATAHKDNLKEITKIMDLSEQMNIRFMHFNYIPTGRAKDFVKLDLSPKERLSLLEDMGQRVINLYLKSKEEEKLGQSDVTVDRFFSTCPQFASVVKKLSEEKGETFTVSAHYAAKKGVEAVANFLGGCGAGRLYIALEPDGNMKPCVFFPTNNRTILGNILTDNFEEIWNNDHVLWSLRGREELEIYKVGEQYIGCGNCEDKYICGGCRARSYGYFNGKINAADIGCIKNEDIWKKIVQS